MALPTGTSTNASGGNGSGKGDLVIAWTDAETAASATEKFAPLSLAASSPIKPIKLGGGVTRLLLRSRANVATTGVTTSPVVWVYGVVPSEGSPEDVDSGTIFRVDNADASGTGITLTLPEASPSTSNMPNDGSYYYGDWSSLDGVDMKGAKWALIVVVTAADVAGAGSVCDVQALAVD